MSWQTIGQDGLLDRLRRALAQGTLSHAYLIVAPRQSGKMRLALDLAKALNCSAAPEKRPCGECTACLKIEAGKHTDVQIVGLNRNPGDPEAKERTEIGIGEIDQLLHSTNLPPFEGRHRVYIIDEAGNLSLEAANRFLKTLEEPPATVTFLLLTENIASIPATIVSRCQRLNLARMKTAELEAILSERLKLESTKAKLLARLSHGRAGWALAAAKDLSVLEERQAQFEKFKTLLAADLPERFATAGQMALQFSRKREATYETLAAWAGWWRDILLVKTGRNSDIISIDSEPDLGEMAGAYPLELIKSALESTLEAVAQLKLNAQSRLVFESLMLNWPAREKSPIDGRGSKNA